MAMIVFEIIYGILAVFLIKSLWKSSKHLPNFSRQDRILFLVGVSLVILVTFIGLFYLMKIALGHTKQHHW